MIAAPPRANWLYFATAMEFTRETASEANAILACTETEVRLKDRAFFGSVIVTRSHVIEGWRPPAIDALAIADFEALLALGPEVVLLGEFRDVAVALML